MHEELFKLAHKDLVKVVAKSYTEYNDTSNLKTPNPQYIRAGIAGGLPLNTVCTDTFLGCLPSTHVCYGNCFAAKAAFESGFNYGKRVENILNASVFMDDLNQLPADQGYVRLGWNSDPSWDWAKSYEICKLIRYSGKLPVLVTKMFKPLSDELLRKFVAIKADFRISISAFDSPAQFELRRKMAEVIRDAGGVAVPVVISASFKKEILQNRQDEMVNYFIERDFPIAENSLRILLSSSIVSEIDLKKCFAMANKNMVWSGRLFPELKISTVTSHPITFKGLQSGYLSENASAFLDSLWFDRIPLYEELKESTIGDKPDRCGVPFNWGNVGSPLENVNVRV